MSNAAIWTPGSNNIPVADPKGQIKSELFTATEGQTDFILTLFTYHPNGGALEVFINGNKAPSDRVTESSTSTFSLLDACEAGDIVEAVGNTEMASADGAAVTALAAADAAAASAALADADRITAEAAAAAAVISAAEAEAAAASINPAAYASAAQGALADTALQPEDIGVTVQGYDADTAKTDVAQNFTLPQRSAILTDNDGVFDLAAKQNFKCTTAGAITVTFSNQADGLSGSVILVNASNHAVSAHANSKIMAADLAKLSATGTYRLDYISDGTNAYCSVAGSY